MSGRRHSTRAKGGKRAPKSSAAADKKKPRVRFPGMDDPRRLVEAIMNEKDPKKRREMETKLAMAEAVRVAKIEGEEQARRAYELGQRTPSETIGPSELLRMLGHDH